jgi:hypothetical protein
MTGHYPPLKSSAQPAPPPNNPNMDQVGGNHYKSKTIQPWDAMQAWMSQEAFAGFLLGNCIKYLARYKDKGGVQDLEKARHYLDKLILVERPSTGPSTSLRTGSGRTDC